MERKNTFRDVAIDFLDGEERQRHPDIEKPTYKPNPDSGRLEELWEKHSPKEWYFYAYAGKNEEGRDKIKTKSEYVVGSNDELVDILMEEIKEFHLKEEDVFNLDNWRWKRDYKRGIQGMWIKLGEHWICICTGLDVSDREHIRRLPPLYLKTMFGPMMVGVIGL